MLTRFLPRLKHRFPALFLPACSCAWERYRPSPPKQQDPLLWRPNESGLSQKAVEIARPFGFPITNSMVVTWIVAVGLIVFAQVATRHMKPVPEGVQNFWEWLVEGLYTFLEGIIGSHLVERTFWFFASVFIFILSANWVGLIPGVGTIGWGHQGRAWIQDRSAVVPRRRTPMST